jgi:hypothetical protein
MLSRENEFVARVFWLHLAQILFSRHPFWRSARDGSDTGGPERGDGTACHADQHQSDSGAEEREGIQAKSQE